MSSVKHETGEGPEVACHLLVRSKQAARMPTTLQALDCVWRRGCIGSLSAVLAPCTA